MEELEDRFYFSVMCKLVTQLSSLVSMKCVCMLCAYVYVFAVVIWPSLPPTKQTRRRSRSREKGSAGPPCPSPHLPHHLHPLSPYSLLSS